MAKYHPEFLKQIEQVSRPIWDNMLKESNLTSDEAETELNMTFEDFCAEVRLELTPN